MTKEIVVLEAVTEENAPAVFVQGGLDRFVEAARAKDKALAGLRDLLASTEQREAEQAEQVVRAIVSGSVPNVSINY